MNDALKIGISAAALALGYMLTKALLKKYA